MAEFDYRVGEALQSLATSMEEVAQAQKVRATMAKRQVQVMERLMDLLERDQESIDQMRREANI